MAGNRWLRRIVPRLWFARRAVRRFMPGEKVEEALAAAQAYQQQGIGILFTHLGENLTSVEEGDRVAQHYLRLIEEIDRRGIEGEVSVKLTQLGFDLDQQRTLEHMERLVDRAASSRAGPRTVWIDMEGSAYTEATVAFYEQLKQRHANVGLCLQAYLKRTYSDVQRLLPVEPRIRLVKGAYAESEEIAFASRREVDANFLALCVSLLEAMRAGRQVFVGLGTHDVELIGQVAQHARTLELPVGAFDIEMLYGIRVNEQRRLRREGHTVGVLIAYGEAWYAWYMRRLAERPANVVFALRQLLP
jgi:proline dehydrogenase